MNRIGILVIGLIVLFAIILLGGAVFLVYETHQVIITQFGRPVGDPVTAPGLHMKVPFIQG